ncbi:MAG: hypothetical protein ACRD1M_16705 [Terriglobales bacterium]
MYDLTVKPMRSSIPYCCLFFLLLAPVSRLVAQGPPFQVDDPVPVDLHHYEFYVFGGADGTPVEMDTTGPAFEFNWGAMPRVQLHAILPWGAVFPAGQPSAFGLVDSELGAKIAFIKESKYFPQIGSFTMLELPTGSFPRGLGIGRVWYKAPLWAQKNIGQWLLDGGGGETFVNQAGYRNFPYGGFLLKYTLSPRLQLGGEVFAHGAEGAAAPQTNASTLVDVGGYYYFKNPNHQFLFCYGHNVAGQTENYAYIGLYWTWGKDKGKGSAGGSPPPLPGFMRGGLGSRFH